MSWSWQKVRSQKRGKMLSVLPLLLLAGATSGLCTAALGTNSSNGMETDTPFFGLGIGLLSILLLSLPAGLLLGLSQSQLDEHARLSPNQGIWYSLRNGLLLGALVGLPIGLLFGLLFWVGFGLNGVHIVSPDGSASIQPLIDPLVAMPGALLLGLILGINGGLFVGEAFLCHFVLRFWLWRTRALPWNLIAFLDEATSRLILRKVGGGYIFIHRLLLDYLASLEKTQTAHPSSNPSPQT